MPKQIKGFKDVRRCCKRNDIPMRRCSTGHWMLGPFSNGHVETVAESKEYGKASRCRPTKLFTALGLLGAIISIAYLLF